MVSSKNIKRFDVAFFIVVLLIYLAGQILIGTYVPAEKKFHFDAPADIDFLYYAGIMKQMEHDFPPQNPAFGGVPLSQSFIQYYPTLLVSQLTNPYLAMRIMNVIYLLLLAFVIRRYFPRGWGAGMAVIAAGSVGFGLINSPGIDLIARGFNHFPFFIAFTIALFEKDKPWLRYICLFLLGWLHSFSGLLALLFFVGDVFINRFRRSSIIDAAVCLAGMITAASITLGVADKPFYFPFVEGFRVDLTDLWMHAIPVAVLVLASRQIRIMILFAVAFVFGLLFHYNPFFPVFILYFSAGWAVLDIIKSRRGNHSLALVMSVLLLIGFIFGAVSKYDPRAGNFIPIIDDEYSAAGQWLEENTPPDAVILTAPTEARWNCRLMERRALYLGFIPHVAHLGIDWGKRGQKILSYFRNPAVYMAETAYVIYGPVERKLFPDFNLSKSPVYRKGEVTIWRIRP